MKNLILLLVLLVLPSVSFSQIKEINKIITQSDIDNQKDYPEISKLQLSPVIQLKNVFQNYIIDLIKLGDFFKYSSQISNGLFNVEFTKEKIYLRILKYRINVDCFDEKAIPEDNVKDIIVFDIIKIDQYVTFKMNNYLNYINEQDYINSISNIRYNSLSALNFNWINNIIIDKEIVNFSPNNPNYGKILNRGLTSQFLNTENEPTYMFGDVTDAIILPHFSQSWNAMLMQLDNTWNRIIMNDQLFQMGFDAIGGDLGCGDSWKFYSPEGLDYGSYSVSNVGCWEYKSYPIYVANTLCNKISKFIYKLGYKSCEPQEWSLNIPDTEWSTVKDNCNYPYDIATHAGIDLISTNDDILWYSESGKEGKLTCINANSGSTIQNIRVLNLGQGLVTIKPSRISIYQSPDGQKNLLSLIDEISNSLVVLKLDNNGYYTNNNVLGVFNFGNSILKSLAINSYNNGINDITIWAVSNSNGECQEPEHCGSIHTFKVNYLLNTPVQVEYLASFWTAANSDRSFVNFNNLNTKNGFVDLFTIEKWNDTYGLRRFKPGINLISSNVTNFCTNTSSMKITLRTTNPSKIKIEDAKYKAAGSGTNWVNMSTFVNGSSNSSFQFLQSGTTILNINIPNVPLMDAPSAEIKVNLSICPQDENVSNSAYTINKEYIVDVASCIQIGGCPYLYVKNNNEFKQDNNILHRSEFYENMDKDIEDKYILKVTPTFNESDSTCEIKIKELNNDISYFDKFSLIAFDHPEGTSLGFTEENNCVLYFPQIVNSPNFAEHNGEDVTSELIYDSSYTKTISGDDEDYVSATFEEGDLNFRKMKIKMKEILTDFSDSMLNDSIAILLDPSQSDRIIIVGPPAKKPAGTISAVDDMNPENPIVKQFSKRQNTSPVIITIGKDVNVDSIISVWNSDFKISYIAVTPIYYGGYIENMLDLIEATDSINGDVLDHLLNSDSIYSIMDSNTNITLKFKNNIGSVEPGFVRNFVFVTKGRYEGAQQVNKGILTFENSIIMGIPDKYRIYQNYPNPFNPTTTIKFDLPIEGIVSIKIFDITGKEVYSINEFKEAGYHSFLFSSKGKESNLSSGIYFYRVASKSFVQSKRMVLIK